MLLSYKFTATLESGAVVNAVVKEKEQARREFTEAVAQVSKHVYSCELFLADAHLQNFHYSLRIFECWHFEE